MTSLMNGKWQKGQVTYKVIDFSFGTLALETQAHALKEAWVTQRNPWRKKPKTSSLDFGLATDSQCSFANYANDFS